MDYQTFPIEIVYYSMEPQSFLKQIHDYHEFVFIEKGLGIHTCQGISTEFKRGDLFWVRKGNEHSFQLTDHSSVFLIRFTEEAKFVLKELVQNSNGKASVLAKAKSLINTKVHFAEDDAILTKELLLLMQSLCNYNLKNLNILYYQMLSLIMLIERNTSFGDTQIPENPIKKDINIILRHIHKYIKDPEMLKQDVIAKQFNMSVNTLIVFFKKEIKMSLKKYTEETRMKAIEKQILQSNATFSEISFRFGFTDESHFNKRFRHHFGLSPKEFRKQKLS